jgi:hypothetical protein
VRVGEEVGRRLLAADEGAEVTRRD